MYRVVSAFRDLRNNDHLYSVGDVYPVEGYKPSKARIKELAEGKNAYDRVFIVEENPVDAGGESSPATENE